MRGEVSEIFVDSVDNTEELLQDSVEAFMSGLRDTIMTEDNPGLDHSKVKSKIRLTIIAEDVPL